VKGHGCFFVCFDSPGFMYRFGSRSMLINCDEILVSFNSSRGKAFT
jgi:hypothetical protein